MIVAYSGAIRFDLFKGDFNRNDQFTSSPFTNAFVYVANVTADVAKRALATLTEQGELRRRQLVDEEAMYAQGEVEMLYQRWLADMAARETLERRDANNLTLGYVTSDVCSPPCSTHRILSLCTVLPWSR